MARTVNGLLLGAAVLTAGCYQKMADQPYYRPLEPVEPVTFFPDGRSSRPLEAGTVARGLNYGADPHFYTGKKAESFFERFGNRASEAYYDTFPFESEVTRDVLERGRERFNIFCAVCHDRQGNGRGMIVQRGFTPPPNFHTDASRGLAFLGEKNVSLRAAPAGYLFSVMTNGFGAMASYSAQVPPEDRWAIAAYIRVLQQLPGLSKEGEK